MGRSLFLWAGAALLTLIMGLGFFQIREPERGLVERLGRWVIDPHTQKPKVLSPGLHWKIPFLDTVRFFDRRIQTVDISSSRIPTAEKKELIVDLFTKWRIKDFAEYSLSTGGNPLRAEQLLREKITNGLRTEFGRRRLNDLVSRDRQLVMDKLRADVDQAAAALGIEVVDARIMRIDLPQEVSEAVFNLMRTERQRVAAEHRAMGGSRAEAICADADAKVTVIAAQAERVADELRGEGEAQAAHIYTEAYSQDSEFYSFYRSLEAYRETFRTNNDILVLKPDDAFFKYFRQYQKQARGPDVSLP